MTGTTDREPSFWIIKHGGCSPSNNWICLHSNRLTHFIRENPDSLGVQLLEYFTERSLEPELLNQEFNEQNNWNFASNWKPLDQTIDIADCCFLLNDKIKFNG